MSERVAPDAGAGFGMPWHRTAHGPRWAMVSAYPHCGRLSYWLRSLVSLEGACSHALLWQSAKPQVMSGPVRLTTTEDAVVAVPRSDVSPRDDLLANRYDAIYRGGSSPRAREVA